jgi:hypothetical protein
MKHQLRALNLNVLDFKMDGTEYHIDRSAPNIEGATKIAEDDWRFQRTNSLAWVRVYDPPGTTLNNDHSLA